jgi:homocitrate synthase
MNEHKQILKNFQGIIDSTLREGFQFAKAKFSLDEQKQIFSSLAGIGVDYIEVGNPLRSEIRDMIVELVRSQSGRRPKILSHIRNHEQDVREAVAIGVDGVNILCTVDRERLASMNKSVAEYRENLCRNIKTARAAALEVRIGVEDFFGQPAEESLEIFRLAETAGADRVALADTLGRAMSWEVAGRIKELRRHIRAPLEAHFHNDLGHAVSNALAALQAGANFISTSLLGIGERTGITPLSSLLINLYVMDERLGKRYNLSLLTEAENYVSRICGIEMPPHLMTNTANGFAHKAGIHLDALMKFGPHKYELLPPRLIGNGRNLVIDSLLSGKTGQLDIKKFLEKHKSGRSTDEVDFVAGRRGGVASY